jgi:hypothetical protein
MLQVDEVVQVLEATPRALRGLLAGLDQAWLRCDEGPDTFSPLDVLGHLIHGEETDWIPRLRLILEHGPTRPFEPFDRFAFRSHLGGASVGELLDRFESKRAENLAALRALALRPEQLALAGRHPALGAVTLGQLLATWAVHDLGHIRQVVRVMARRYGSEVGPWREYLSILTVA